MNMGAGKVRREMSAKTEGAWIALVVFLFLVVNVVTAERYPFPFFDEVLYLDPAVNYVTGHGFTTVALGQGTTTFYSYNSPAYSALLIPWLKIFGMSLRSARSINFLYMVASIVLIWSGAKRMQLISPGRWRILLVVMLLCDYSIIFSYRVGRYDCLGILVMAVAFWSFSLKKRVFRLWALAIAGAATPWAGLQLLPFEVVFAGTLVAFTASRFWREIGAVTLGSVAGGIGLIWFFQIHGVLRNFLRFPVVYHVDLGQVLHFRTREAGFATGLLQGQFHHSNVVPKDFSFAAMFLAAALLAFGLYRSRSLHVASALVFALVFAPMLSVTLILLAKFPTYYGWMICIPVAICTCGSLEQKVPGAIRNSAIGLCVLGCVLGIGLHALACARDWQDRDYSKIQRFVSSIVHADDWAYVVPQSYYPTKLLAAATFFGNPGTRMSSSQRSRVTVCIIGPDSNWVLKELGGEWYSTGQEMIPARIGLFGNKSKWGVLSFSNYRLSVYRRVPRSWDDGSAAGIQP